MTTAVQAAAGEQVAAVDGALSPLAMPFPESPVGCCCVVEVTAMAAAAAYRATNELAGREALRDMFRHGARVGEFTVSEAGASMIKSASPLSVAELVCVRVLD